jgi:hypothetical protein
VALGRAARIKYETTGQGRLHDERVHQRERGTRHAGQEAFDYYGTARNTGARWANRSATMFFEPFLQFNSIDSGSRIQAATLVIHSDACSRS